MCSSPTDLASYLALIGPHGQNGRLHVLVQVTDHHLVIAFDQIAAHGAAHIADADKSQFHNCPFDWCGAGQEAGRVAGARSNTTDSNAVELNAVELNTVVELPEL